MCSDIIQIRQPTGSRDEDRQTQSADNLARPNIFSPYQ
jgi:hypothetical protein